jgi:hypothetical protein
MMQDSAVHTNLRGGTGWEQWFESESGDPNEVHFLAS